MFNPPNYSKHPCQYYLDNKNTLEKRNYPQYECTKAITSFTGFMNA